MEFSVLIAVYNKEKPIYLKNAIESVINQTLKPNQIVILKDGKLNNELEKIIQDFVTKYPDIMKICGYKENMGLGYALQRGIIECDYPYIARMDSDDIAKKNRFEVQINYIKEHSDIDILGGYVQEYDEKMENKISVRKIPILQKEIYKEIGKQNPFNHSTVIIRKEAVLKAGNYRLTQLEDYTLWIQMYVNECKMANLPQILVDFRAGEGMYKRRSGIKYLKGIKKIEDMLLEYRIINMYGYIKNMIVRTILAFIPAKLKKVIYPKIIRKR